MLTIPDERTKNALRLLASKPELEPVLEWLHASHAQLHEQSESLQEVAMYRNQGARQLLSDIDRHIAAASGGKLLR